MTPTAWHRRPRIPAAIVAGMLALYAVAGFLVVPPVAREKIVAIARAELGREARIGEVAFNPFTLKARVRDFVLDDRRPGRALLSFESLEVDVSASSAWRRAPVIDAIRLVRPRVEIARGADGRLNVQDLLDRPAPPPPPGAPAGESAFALFNIEVEDGSLVLDDALRGHRTEVTKLAVGIPFLSSLARDVAVRVTPHLRGAIDGAPFALEGRSTSPFEETQRATLDIDLDALPLPRYVEYAPLPGGLTLAGGALTTRLKLDFLTWKGKPRGMTLSGGARLEGLALARRDGTPLASARTVDLALQSLDPIGRAVRVGRLAIEEPVLELHRLRDGSLEPARLLAAAAPAQPAPAAPDGSAPRPWAWHVAQASLGGGEIRFHDEAVAPAFRTTVTGITVDGTGIASEGRGAFEAAFEIEGARFSSKGDLDVAARAARGRLDIARLAPGRFHPYYAPHLALDLRRGLVDAGADFEVSSGPEPRVALANGTATLAGFVVALRGEREPLLRLAHAGAQGMALDLGKREVVVGNLEAREASLRVVRGADGAFEALRALPSPGGAGESAPPATGAPAAPGWQVLVREARLERIGADFEDRTTATPARLRVADLKLAAANLGNAPGTRATVALAARIGANGRIRVDGTATPVPAAAELQVAASSLDLLPLQPYVESRTQLSLTAGLAEAKGRLSYRGDGPEGPQVRYAGEAAIRDFGSRDRPGNQELLRWESLRAAGLEVTSAPFSFAAQSVALERFYARLILDADATLNVLRLLAPERASPAPADPSPRPAADAPAAPRREIAAAIGRIALADGEVEYADFFVRPNFSAHLTELNGSVAALSTTRAGPFELTAKVGGTAPVDIRGVVNPFARELALALQGKATGVDLPPLTPYSAKYAGYGIEKGKLTMTVDYRLEDRKLSASNRLVLDQLTFGDRVESPTATKLPVLLLVSLLKDRNGVIDLDLPVAGTLDDPQFSIWGVVVKIIVNLLTKAVTAPFALLGAIAGGGEELAFVEFAPGSAALAPAAVARLGTLAKALADRPGLRLEMAGRAVPEADREALKRATIERELLARKRKALAAGGETAPAPQAITLDAAERERYLRAYYRNADIPGKPRNFLGIARDIPPAEMEALLLAGLRIDEAALRDLAEHRAQAVSQWLAAEGGIAVERLFVTAPKLSAEGIPDKGAATRVDFSLR